LCVKYGGGYYLKIGTSKRVDYSTTGKSGSWTNIGNLAKATDGHLIYGYNGFVHVYTDGSIAYATNPTNINNWKFVGGSSSACPLYDVSTKSDWSGLAYGDGKWVACTQSGDTAVHHGYNIADAYSKYESKIKIGSASEQAVALQQEFHIEPSQISDTKDADGNYYIDITASSLRLVSVEITNRPYTVVTPDCYLGGTTSTASSATAYVYTNIKEPITIQAKRASYGNVTFSNSGQQNYGTHKVTSFSTFTFSGYSSISSTATYTAGPNFSSRGINKVPYSLSNASITSATLSGQLLRADSIGIDDGLEIRSNASKITSLPYGDDDFAIIVMGASGANVYYYMYDNGSPERTQVYHVGLPSNSRTVPTDSYGNSFQGTSYFYIASYCHILPVPYCSNDGCSYNSYNVGISVKNQPASTTLNRFYAKTNQTIPFVANASDADVKDNKCITATGSYIKFTGDGTLSVKVAYLGNSGSISYTTLGGTSSSTTISSSSYTNVSISPSTHRYMDQGNGTYAITLSINNVELATSPKFTYTLPSPYCKITGKPAARSYTRSVDGSLQTLNASYFTTRSLSRTHGFNNYNTVYGYHMLNGTSGTASGAGYCSLTSTSCLGDVTTLTEEFVSPVIIHAHIPTESCGDYYCPGLVRLFGARNRKKIYSIETYTSASYINRAGIMAVDYTWPLNAVLIKNGWQTIAGSETETTGVTNPMNACQSATAAVCNKLKENANLRIYIIKYRGQTAGKDALGKAISYDYGYLKDNCASGNAAPYWQEVDTESNLKTALDAIAANIKTWAGYEKAKVVE
jgi:hypothetical protein